MPSKRPGPTSQRKEFSHMITRHGSPVVITEAIDAATVAEGYRAFLEYLAEGTDVDIAAETVAATLDRKSVV